MCVYYFLIKGKKLFGQPNIWKIIKKEKKRIDIERVVESSYGKRYEKLKEGNVEREEEYLNVKIPTRTTVWWRLAGKKTFYCKEEGYNQRIKKEQLCTLCNRCKEENIEHILLECPLYEQIRTLYLKGKETMEELLVIQTKGLYKKNILLHTRNSENKRIL